MTWVCSQQKIASIHTEIEHILLYNQIKFTSFVLFDSHFVYNVANSIDLLVGSEKWEVSWVFWENCCACNKNNDRFNKNLWV